MLTNLNNEKVKLVFKVSKTGKKRDDIVIVPEKFISKVKKKKVSLCEVIIGGFDKRTKCINNIPIDIELDKKNRSIDIFPTSPIPSGEGNYAIVLNVINPNRGGLYQFHSFGQSSGNIPVSFYIGSWTLKILSI